MKAVTVALSVFSTALVASLAATEYGNLPEEPASWIAGSYEAPVRIDAGGGRHPEVSIHELDTLITVLYLPADALDAAAALNVIWTRLAFSGIDHDDLDLYQVMLPVDLLLKADPWNWWLNVTPGPFSDLDRVTGDDYRTLLHGAVLYRSGPHLQWGLGLGYDRVLGEDRVYPLGGFVWDNGWDLRLNALLPELRLEWAPSRSWLAYLQVQPAGGVWHVRDAGSEYDLKIEGFRIYGGGEMCIAPHVWLQAGTGLTAFRNYELKEKGGNRIDSDAEEAWFARVALLLR